MLHVQTYLRSGKTLEDLKAEFAIKPRDCPDLGVVVLNYDQIASDPNHPIVQECRALILEQGTWKVLSWPFKRFFNLGEQKLGMERFDWSQFKALEKLDGSLISLWHHPVQGWQTATRSVADGMTPFDDSGETFHSLIRRTLVEMGTSFEAVTAFLTPGKSYSLELTAPENQVVVHHNDRKLSLIGIRDLSTLEEMDPEFFVGHWDCKYQTFPLPTAPCYPGFDPRLTPEAVEGRNPLEHEGYVLVDRNFNRVKVKSSAYCLMSNRKDSLAKSNASRIELILSSKDDDVLPMLPVFVQEKILALKAAITALARRIDEDYQTVKDIEVQKDFALAVLPMDKTGGCSSAMFALRKGFRADGMDFLRSAAPKFILQAIKVQDEEAEPTVSE